MKKTLKIADDKNHPKLKAIRAALKKDPTLTKYFTATMFSIGYDTLKAWVDRGWVEFKPVRPDNKTYSWGKIPGPHRPYDLNTTKVKK